MSLADMMTQEIGGMAFGVSSGYDWHILELISDADKLVYAALDKMAVCDPQLRLAVRKLKPRVAQATQLTRQTAAKLTTNEAENTKKMWFEATQTLEAKNKVCVEQEQQISQLKQITQAVTEEDVVKIDLLADELNQEIGHVSFGVTDSYQWQILDDIAEGHKIVFNCLDRLGTADNKARFAMRKLRTRMTAAIPAVKNAVK